MSDYVDLTLSRGEARGLVEILERLMLGRPAAGVEKPMIVMDIACRLERLLGEPRPYPKLPPRRRAL